MIDTHCHLSTEYYDDIDNVIKENRLAGISKIIISGCCLNDFEESINYSKKFNDVYLTLGFHPSEAKIVTEKDLELLESKLKSCNKIVGVGEIGLDYHYGKEDKDLQILLFKKQLEIAEKVNLPVVIHSRDAVEDTINILKQYNVKGVIHCFNCSYEIASIYIKMGFKLGIGGVLTFKNCKLPSVIEKIGINNLVLETDSPYLSPEPIRGTTNSSKNIPFIVKKLSEILNISLEEVDFITTNNAYSVFDLK